uniref:Glucosylceramidase n=1 Tax=Panagrellus redivivus TaxID=6233 RepID=A0A7E4W3U0_PANRE
MKLKDVTFTLFSTFAIIAALPCDIKSVTSHGIHGFTCSCNASYCDTIEDFQVSHEEVLGFVSSDAGKRFQKFTVKQSDISNDSKTIKIKLNSSQTFQKIEGFGAAFTDAATINLKKLSPATQNKLLEAYFDPIKGLGYTFGRVPLGSCDFSTRVYSYDDTDQDFNLTHFALAKEDLDFKIPAIQAAKKFNNDIKLFASPWSSPAWMKATKDVKGYSGLAGDINGPYYKSYAKYFGRFLQEYSKHGLQYWGLTVTNEPSGCYGYQCMIMNASTQIDFVALHLREALNKAGFETVKIMIHDDTRNKMVPVAKTVAADPEKRKLIDGLAFHWYDWNTLEPVRQTHELLPDKFTLSTEACNGWQDTERGVYLGSWLRATRYARDIIRGINAYSIGWVDWNFCLDGNGGPNWVSNFVDSPIIVDETSDSFIKQPMYYALGHFSRFVPPNSKRIYISSPPANLKLEATATLTPDNTIVVVVLNDEEKPIDVEIADVVTGKPFQLSLDSRSITTLLYKLA